MSEIKKFSDVVKNDPVYPDSEYIQDKKELIGKTFIINEFTEVEGGDGNYAVVLAEKEGKKISFSIGGVVYDQLIKAKDKLPLEVELIEQKSKAGRVYFTLK